jgi:hypothetical protein
MPPIDRAIGEYHFACGRESHKSQVGKPADALPLAAVSSQLVDLFERAFGPGSARANARPTAASWYEAQKAFFGSLLPCTTDSGHVYAPLDQFVRLPLDLGLEDVRLPRPRVTGRRIHPGLLLLGHDWTRPSPAFELARSWPVAVKVTRP